MTSLAEICCSDLNATTSSQLTTCSEGCEDSLKIQVPVDSAGVWPLSSKLRHLDCLLTTQTNLWGKEAEKEFIFLDLRGSSTSLVRRRKGLLIAQEEGSLIWRPLWCSSLQPHGELISTWAIDRKRETWRGWREQKARGGAVAMRIHQHHIYLLLSDEVIPPVIEAQFWSIWLCLMHSWMSVYLELNQKVSRLCLKKVIESLI